MTARMPKTRRALAVLAALAGAAALVVVACTQTRPVSDDELSLRKGGLTGTVSEEAPAYTAPEAGDSQPLDPAFYGAPPMIPHSVEGLWVAVGANDCLDCHELGDADTPAIPPSHRIKARVESEPPGQVTEGQVTRVEGFYRVRRVAGNRFACLTCHAPQSENALLVENAFSPEQPDDSGLQDALDTLNEEGDF